MLDNVELSKLTAAKSKAYVKPTLVKGPILASVTALSKNISGVQQNPV
jgi:hypothetical protein